ncbi:MAG: hypothetical protein JWO94_991 [Verrucomicrobiaceae bacterium]|nr:hypothetical protein [Verrucomicrobiaceae bacterium]
MRLTSLFLPCLTVAALALSACHKAPAAKNNKTKRDESSAHQSQEREATESFANAVLAVMAWRRSLPMASSRTDRAAHLKELTTRFQAVPTQDLPPEVLHAWQALQQACAQLGDALASPVPPSAAEMEKLETQGKKAGETLNRWLETQGLGELHF